MWHNVKNVTKQRLADVILTYIDTLYKRNRAGKYPNPIKNHRTYSRFQIGNSNPKAESGDHNRCRLCSSAQIKIRRSKQARALLRASLRQKLPKSPLRNFGSCIVFFILIQRPAYMVAAVLFRNSPPDRLPPFLTRYSAVGFLRAS